MKIMLLTAKWCPYCPSAKKIWEEVKKEAKFDYEEIDIETPKGKELVDKHSIMSVPTTILQDESGTQKVAFVGVPTKQKALDLVKK